MRRRALIAAGVVLGALLLGLVWASAAQLAVRSGDVTSITRTHPCPGQGSASSTSSGSSVSHVAVVLPSQACAGLVVQLTVLSGTGAVLGQGSATVSGSTATVRVTPAFSASASLIVRATVAGWNLPLTWQHASSEPVFAGNPSTTLSPVTWTLISNNPVQACFTASVSTGSAAPVAWRVTLDLARPPFNGAAPSELSLQGADGWRYQWFVDTPVAGLLQIGGTTQGGRLTIVAGQSYEVQVCSWNLPPGVQTPSAYTVAESQTTWTDTKACIATTVTGNGTERFYFGWTALVDMRPAVDRLAQAGRPLSAYSYSSNEWMLARTAATDVGPEVFRVVSGSPADLSMTDSFTFETCANSFG